MPAGEEVGRYIPTPPLGGFMQLLKSMLMGNAGILMAKENVKTVM